MQTKKNLISAAEQIEETARANLNAGFKDLAAGQFEAVAKLRNQAAQMPDEPESETIIPKEGTREWEIFLDSLRNG